jgi:hypothetical protein
MLFVWPSIAIFYHVEGLIEVKDERNDAICQLPTITEVLRQPIDTNGLALIY